uniref:Uncharacterized protein n=1 Tax=Arundo donax TaxID=35708 RepID=A0A0A9EPX7_ARUDO
MIQILGLIRTRKNLLLTSLAGSVCFTEQITLEIVCMAGFRSET